MPPCGQQFGPITGYAVRYYATCGPDRDVQQTKSVVTTGSIIDGLTPNTEYAFQVAAVNTNGIGPFSEAITLGGKHLLYLYIATPDDEYVLCLNLMKTCKHRNSTIGDGQSSELHHHDCLLE